MSAPYTLAGVVSDLHGDLVDITSYSDKDPRGLVGNRSITFSTRNGRVTFPIPADLPAPALGARVRITFEVLP
jgi:hypothetical protein